MQLPLPSSEHPQVQVHTVTADETLTTTLDKSHKVAEIALPEGTDESRVQHFAEFLNSRGQAVGEKMIYLKGSWQSWNEEVAAKLREEAAAAEKAAKDKAAAAKAKASSTASAVKAKVEAAVAPVQAKVEAHKTELTAAVETAEIAAEVLK